MSESRISWIAQITRMGRKNSVKSFHPCQSVIQTIYDIVKAHGGELNVSSKESEAGPDKPVGQGSEFTVILPDITK